MTMRTFIALEFPPTIHAQLADAAQRLRSYLRSQRAPDCLRWAGLHNAHLTLRFLGDTTSVQARLLADALADIAQHQPPFELMLGHIDAFPNVRQPRVLWLGVAGDVAPLHTLHSAIEQRVTHAGFPAETRPFSPHITLARANQRASRADLRLLGQLVQEYAETIAQPQMSRFQVTELVHMQSQLQRGGAVHTSLGRFQFGASTKA
ncbi:MAG: RNA 2',3'-cyclic phosphodiesterase [Caldilineaceae bacterium]|nr:RNA 2',3'-cyclic phosphodiesterase [Caldilineaceae bacterium]